MGLTAGTRLGAYEIVSPIGAGGMSACGPASERPFDCAQGRPEPAEGRSETSRWPGRGGGAPRQLLKQMTNLAHSRARQWD